MPHRRIVQMGRYIDIEQHAGIVNLDSRDRINIKQAPRTLITVECA